MPASQIELPFEADREARARRATADPLRRFAERLPRPLRFLLVGGIGLVVDLGFLTLAMAHAAHPLAARPLSLLAATLVTWRLNRALTFERSGRRQGREAMRYAAVTAVAQATSYAVFAAIVLMAPRLAPQLALLAGAAAAALISYNGHRLIAFAPQRLASGRAPR
ncbi:MAG: GtrA family protein [Proteobacteria bacterium]|nr:GtrA family protein [Pseudomonadota bacterium]